MEDLSVWDELINEMKKDGPVSRLFKENDCSILVIGRHH